MTENLNFLGFIVAALVLLLIPGPGVMYVVARTVAQGCRAGLASAVGLSMGVLVHVAAATLGLSAILLTSATAFTIVKILGAVYLFYLAIQVLRSSHSTSSPLFTVQLPTYRIILDGIIVSVFNPKIAIFFMAFLPQFVVIDSRSIELQIMFLGITYAGLALVTDSLYALTATLLKSRVPSFSGDATIFKYLGVSLFVGLGLHALVSVHRSN